MDSRSRQFRIWCGGRLAAAWRAQLIALLLVAAACSRRESTSATFPKASVILISIDTLRADHLPLYGYKDVETPNIDALAKEGIVFDTVWSQCPLTLPSHISMLTGLLPTTHGVRNNLGFRYDASKFPALSQILQRNGYTTGGIVSSYVLRGEKGLRAAFDFYDDNVSLLPGTALTEYQRPGGMSADIAGKWVASVGKRPFFCFLHLYEPHTPYTPPEPFRSRFRNPYDGEIATADSIVGTFVARLKELGVYDDAIVILTSDHGEGLSEHGEEQHGILLYTEAIHVPLIVKLPHAMRGNTRISGNAALVDVVPTVIALLGMAPSRTDGTDLLAGALPERDIYSETIYPYIQLGWSDLRSIVHGRLHYIHSPRPELYDLEKDPKEQHDVIADHRREAASFRAEVEKFPPPATGNVSIDPEEAAKLAALGYVGSVRARPDAKSLPNPKDNIDVIEQIRQVSHLASEHRYDEAIAQMQSILAKNPRLIDVWIRLAEAYQDTGQAEKAIDAYKEAIAAAGPDLSSDIVASLAYLYFQIGRVKDAENAAELARRGNPDKVMPLLVRIAATTGHLAKAEKLAREIVNRPNPAPQDIFLLAEIRQAQGDDAEALKLIAQAQAAAESAGLPPISGLEARRGQSLVQLKRPAEAIRAYETEILNFPRNENAYGRLAVLYLVTGDRAAMDRTLEKLVAENPTPSAYDLAARILDTVGDKQGAARWRARKPR